MERVTFVGACNPPESASVGRVKLSARFARHVPVLFVGYPEQNSLRQIYGSFMRGLVHGRPQLMPYAAPVADAMVDYYQRNKTHFIAGALTPHYVYSPRELSRWVGAVHEALSGMGISPQGVDISPAAFTRLWAHMGLRIFADRLVASEEVEWCHRELHAVVACHLATPMALDTSACLQRPILYSRWGNEDGSIRSVDRGALREALRRDLGTFCGEELGDRDNARGTMPLVMYDTLQEWALRIDNVLRTPMGHLLLAGEAGVGKSKKF